MASANSRCVKPIGFRNSSTSISPRDEFFYFSRVELEGINVADNVTKTSILIKLVKG